MEGACNRATKQLWKERDQRGRIWGDGVAEYFICLQQKLLKSLQFFRLVVVCKSGPVKIFGHVFKGSG